MRVDTPRPLRYYARMFQLGLTPTPTSATWSVADLNRYVRQQLETDYRLKDVRVKGEISGFKAYPSGHWYFTLKDATAQVSCVVWRGRAEKMRYRPKDGDAVEAHGNVTLYETRGQFQLDVTWMQPSGEGELFRDFVRLKAQLEAEGLFAPERKRPLPHRPRTVGLVTSQAGAALRDLLTVLGRRQPLLEVWLAPAQVQGPEAPGHIVAALQALYALKPDVIIVARGGGALEDLWAFNDEAVARTIAASPVPVVSGVGHETDFTIADFVADLRAPTPSAAAEMVAHISSADLRNAVDDLTARMADALLMTIQERRFALAEVQAQLAAQSPAAQVRHMRQQVTHLNARAQLALRHRLALEHERVQRLTHALNAISPLAVLQRGYAIVQKTDGTVVRQVGQLQPGEVVRITVSDGEIKAKTLNH